jgi:hypothetical protein
MDKYYSKFEFKRDDTNKIVSVIYPLNEIINENITYKENLGGSTTYEYNESSRFQGLGVPMGLYLSKPKNNLLEKSMNKNYGGNSKNEKEHNVIDDKLFEELFEKITVKIK